MRELNVDVWINIVLAFFTFLAVLVALFQEVIRKWWNKAVLDMEINLTPPDSHQIFLSNEKGLYIGTTVYLRIKVIHKKGSAGENVEIMPTNFWRISKNANKPSTMKHFLPINLVWSHFQPRTNTIRIPVGSFRHCDFGHFLPNDNMAILVLDTMIQPNPVSGGDEIPNIFKNGKYQFKLLLSGDNVKALQKKWEIEFEKWSEDESEMLNSNITIREVK